MLTGVDGIVGACRRLSYEPIITGGVFSCIHSPVLYNYKRLNRPSLKRVVD